MIIPIRCMTCGKVLADKWEFYQRKCSELNDNKLNSNEKTESNDKSKFFDKHMKGHILDELGLHKMCCRRHMLGHVDLIDTI